MYLLSHNWLIKRIVYEAVQRTASKYVHGVLLDIGCREKPYESVFSPYVNDYIGLDHEETFHDKSKINVVATAYDTTMANEFVDTILCLSVLEHLGEPNKAIREANRVLKKGGYAIYTVSLF